MDNTDESDENVQTGIKPDLRSVPTFILKFSVMDICHLPLKKNSGHFTKDQTKKKSLIFV